MSGGALEGFAEFRESLNETAVRQEKAAVFHTHVAIKAARLAGRIMAEGRGGQLGPLALGIGDPLRAVEALRC